MAASDTVAGGSAPAAQLGVKIDWLHLLRHFLQTAAFCLAVGALQYFFSSSESYEVPLVYSLAIGITTWAIIDFGRFALSPDADSGWPSGGKAILLIAGGITCGYAVGTLFGDHWFGRSSWNGVGRYKLLTSLVITLLSAGTAIAYFYVGGHNAALRARAQTAQRQAAENRLKLLQSQLDPHMLFNSLAVLRSLIATDPERAIAMLDRMNDYLRATLTASRATMHPLATEFARLADYLELMAVRMGPRLRYEIDLPPELADLPVPTLLLQPLVENSIRHGLEPKVEGGEVIVAARRAGDTLLLTVTDSGVGLARQVGPEAGHAGFGLTQVRERLQASYGDAAALHFGAGERQRLCATIQLPMGASR